MAGTDNSTSGFSTSGGNATFRSLTMEGDIAMQGNAIRNVGAISGLAEAWSIDADGTIKTVGTLKAVIESYQGEKIEVPALLGFGNKVTLSGTAVLANGTATIRFEDADPAFNDVISTTDRLRVLVTLRGPANGVYVSESDHDGFTVVETMGGSSSAEFDWFVEGYRKDYEPAPVVETPPAEIPPADPVLTDPPPADPVVTDPPPSDPTVADPPASDPAVSDTLPAEEPPAPSPDASVPAETQTEQTVPDPAPAP
jgi:hypothetical protein